MELRSRNISTVDAVFSHELHIKVRRDWSFPHLCHCTPCSTCDKQGKEECSTLWRVLGYAQTPEEWTQFGIKEVQKEFRQARDKVYTKQRAQLRAAKARKAAAAAEAAKLESAQVCMPEHSVLI